MLIELNSSGLGATVAGGQVAAVGYADDVLLMSDLEEHMNQLLRICEAAGQRLSILWNPTKSMAMLLGEKKITKHKRKELQLRFCGSDVKRVKQLKYLGYELTESLTQKHQVDKTIAKAMAALHSLRSVGIMKPTMSLQLKLHLYQTFCRTILTNGLEVGSV